MWKTAMVYLKANGFGKGYELEDRIITIRPDETTLSALKREGYNANEVSRVKELFD